MFVCISLTVSYWGESMGNEATAYYKLAIALTFIISLPTLILWKWLLKKIKYKKMRGCIL